MSTELHAQEPTPLLIGGFHLCDRGHGMVRNGQSCPQCELEATLTPEQKAAMLKAWAQEQVRKSDEHLRELTQVFVEGSTKQRGRPTETGVPVGHKDATRSDAGMDARTVGDPAEVIRRLESENAALRAEVARLKEALELAAQTLDDAATTFKLFQKHTAAEAMSIAATATRAELTAQPSTTET